MLQLQSCYMMFENTKNAFTTKNIGWHESLQPCAKWKRYQVIKTKKQKKARRSNWWNLQLTVSSVEGRPKWSPTNFASGGSPTSGSYSMPPNIKAPKIQLYHGLLSTTKHHKNTRTDLFLWICRPPSLCYVLLLSLLSPSCGLSLCAWEKEKQKAEVLLGQWHSWPLASRRVGCKLWVLYVQ